MADRKEELRDVVKDLLPEPVIALGYTEHQIDLMAVIIKELAALIDPANITPELQRKLDMLELLIAHSSVDFNNLDSPLEGYKIPGAVNLKAYTRQVQGKYLKKQLEEGLL
jgi:predicted translin family RNA/ssDNA-binding protein